MTARISLLAVLAFAGCKSVGRDYAPPQPDAPAAWRDEAAAGLAHRSADFARWWRQLGDPVLDELIERALGQGLDVRESLARVQEARALRGVARADRYPSIDALLSYERRGESQNTPFGSFLPDSEVYSASLEASWEVDLWGRVRRSVEAADADLAASEEDARAAAVAVAAETALHYVQLRAFQRRLEVARTALRLQQETLALVQARFDAGLVRERDLAQAATLLESVRARIPALEIGERAAENRLAVLLGASPGSLAHISSPAPIPVAPPEVAVGLPAELLRRRPDVRRAERVLAAETARIGVAEGELHPRLALAGSLGLAAQDPGDLTASDSVFHSIGPSLRWHLFDAGRVRNRVAAQDARAEQALVRWERTVLAALEEAENALTAFAREQARRASLAEATAQARRAVELAQTQYTEGLSDFQVVLDSQRELAALDDELAQSDAAIAANLVALYRALGGI